MMSAGIDQTTIVGSLHPSGTAVHSSQRQTKPAIQPLDTFACGVCRISLNDLGAFLQHKISHNSRNGMYFCLLCKSQVEYSEGTLHHHYLYFHHVAQTSAASEILSSENELDCFSDTLHKVSDVDDHSCQVRDEEDGGNIMISACGREDLLSASEELVHPCECPKQETDTGAVQFCTSIDQSDLGGAAMRQSFSEEGCKYEMMEDTSRLGSDLLRNNQITGVAGDDDSVAVKSILCRPLLKHANNPENDVSSDVASGDCSCKPIQRNLESRRNPVLSSAAMSKIKKFASTAVTGETNGGDGQRKIIIVCSPGMNERTLLPTLGRDPPCVQKLPLEDRTLVNQSIEVVPMMDELRPSFPRMTDSCVDVTKYEKDFLFQFGMKESEGKHFRYMREVYICLYCKTFERHCLDRLIVHMMDSHGSEIMDRFPSWKMEGVTVKPISGVTDSDVTSFQKYRSKLLDQKTKEKARRCRQEKGNVPTKAVVLGLPCVYCSKRFATPRKLQAHTDKHLNVKRFLCEDCGRSFRSWHLLWSHKKDHINASYGKIKCSLCSFQSGDTQALNNHYRIHPKQSHLCHICGNMYSSLRKHVKVHSLDRPYPCPFKGCTFRFTSKVPCKIHYQAHTVQGQRFACGKCDSRFARRHHLLRHLAKVHGDSVDAHQETTCNRLADHLSTTLGDNFNVGQVEPSSKTEELSFPVDDQHHMDIDELVLQ